MSDDRSSDSERGEGLPPDDLRRGFAKVNADGEDRPHVGVVGDTYTVLLTGADTAGRFCLIDMHVPPGGGPPLHRHDFEETFIVQDGELDVTFREEQVVVRTGETVHIPANAPHRFHNSSAQPVRMLCICSPAGQEKFFLEAGVPVSSRTAVPPNDEAAQARYMAKAAELAHKYGFEILKGA